MQFINVVRPKKVKKNPEDVAKFLELVKDFAPPKENAIVSATVTKVIMESENEGWVCSSIGGKSEFWLSYQDFYLQGHGETPKEGDTIQIYYIKNEAASFAIGAQTRSWNALERCYKELQPVEGIILRRSKKRSGYMVAILPYGARGFLSLSKANMSLIKAKGQDAVFMFRIIKMDRRSLHIALSMGDSLEPKGDDIVVNDINNDTAEPVSVESES